MQAGYPIKTGLAGLCLLFLGSCDDAPFGNTGGGSSLKAQYAVARDALETGNYPRANRTYARLIDKAGPLEPRMRLEYSHSLLRGGDYAEAAKQARYLAARSQDVARSAALAVQGTAEHELGIKAIATGDGVRGRKLLGSASRAIGEVLTKHPGLDPLGALAGRQAQIKAVIKRG